MTRMDPIKIESVLYACRRALLLLHPVMNENEPCYVYEAYKDAGELLRDLEPRLTNATTLLEQAVSSLEMIYNLAGDLIPKDKSLLNAMRKVTEAQEIIHELSQS